MTTTTTLPTPAATTPAAVPTPAATTFAAVKPPVSSQTAKASAATGMAGKTWNRAGWLTLVAGGIIGLGMFGFLAWHGSITQGHSNPAPVVNNGPVGVESNMVGGSTT